MAVPGVPWAYSLGPEGALIRSSAQLTGLHSRVDCRGLAKSRSVRAVLDRKASWIEGNAIPFGMYGKLYRHRDEFVVIDDVDAHDDAWHLSGPSPWSWPA